MEIKVRIQLVVEMDMFLNYVLYSTHNSSREEHLGHSTKWNATLQSKPVQQPLYDRNYIRFNYIEARPY